MKFGIGTVQFGLNYGVSNKLKIPEDNEVKNILSFLKKNNIQYIDTASLYGLSEKKIGKFSPLRNNFKIITKTIKIFDDEVLHKDLIEFKENIMKSLEYLKRKSIYAILIHRESDLLKPGSEEIYNYLIELKKKKIIKKIGFSSYSPSKATKIIHKFDFDMIQVPINILNQVYLENNFLKKLKGKNFEIHARSILGQGILAENENAIKLDLNYDLKNKIKYLLKFLSKKDCSLCQAAILFVRKIEEVDVSIFGIHNLIQLKEIYNLFINKTDLDFNLGKL